MAPNAPSSNLYLVLAILLGGIVLNGAIDLFVLDDLSEISTAHVAFELAMIGFSLAVAVYLWLNWYRTRHSLATARRALEQRGRERDLWRSRAQKILQGLGEAIDLQLKEWGLTPAERQTALFLLKGLSHKEIAQLNSKSERTVRQHAISVYRKSGLRGRAELSAFFLEDLLLPQE